MFYSCGWCRQLIGVVFSYFTFLPSARREPLLGIFLPAAAAQKAGMLLVSIWIWLSQHLALTASPLPSFSRPPTGLRLSAEIIRAC